VLVTQFGLLGGSGLAPGPPGQFQTGPQQGNPEPLLTLIVGHLTNLVEARAAREETQQLAMMTWMQETEQKWDARHEDNIPWGVAITNMIAKTMKPVEQGEEGREREREMTARMDGGGLEASQHANTTQEEGPEERQPPQQQPKPKPKLQLKVQPKPQPAPKLKSAPKPARWWETVPPRAKSPRAPLGPGAGPGPTLTAGSRMAERHLILQRDESISLSNKMDQEIASAINRALFYQKALAHIKIMNAKKNAKDAITAIKHPNATAEMAMQYRDIILTAARTVDRAVMDVEENEIWERLEIHPVPLVGYIGNDTEVRQKMQQEFEAENEGIAIRTQVRWLANPRTIRERRQNGEIAASSVVFVVMRRWMAQSFIKTGIEAVGVWY